MTDFIKIEVTGIEELKAALEQFPREAKKYLAAAGSEAGKAIIETEGLKKYPPADAANAPPTPYYIRGRGTQYKYGNNMKSEKYGTRFTVVSSGYSTVIGNSTSYAKWLAGAEQSHVMQARGWRKLIDVTKDKMPEIVRIYNAWVEKLLIACRLK